jgi:hypothetical protein
VIALTEMVVLAAEIYLGVGLVFAILFAWRGAAAIDPAAQDGTLGFRVLIVPASALLWPFLLRRWLRRSPPPVERNAHRDAAAGAATAATRATLRSGDQP